MTFYLLRIHIKNKKNWGGVAGGGGGGGLV